MLQFTFQWVGKVRGSGVNSEGSQNSAVSFLWGSDGHGLNLGEMTEGTSKIEARRKEGGHWLELKEAWRGLAPGAVSLGLSDDAKSYFQALTFRYFSKVLGSDGLLVRFGLVSPSVEEAWSIMFRELYLRRTTTGTQVFDDIFIRAFESARKAGHGDSAEVLLGYFKNQYEMCLRNVVRSWAREQLGSLGRNTIVSLDGAKKGGEHDGPCGHDVIHDGVREDEDLEMRDLQRCGRNVADEIFAGMDFVSRTCILLHALRVSLAHPLVVTTLGKGKSVLFDHERKMRLQVVSCCKMQDPELDSEGQMYLAAAAYRSLREQCEKWFFSEMQTSPLFPIVMQRIPRPVTTEKGVTS